MNEYITHHLRDGEEISFEEWNEKFKEDLDKESKRYKFDLSGAVYADLGNGCDIRLDGHLYQRRTDVVYDSAKELFEDMVFDDGGYFLVDILREMTDDEIEAIIVRHQRVMKQGEKLVLLPDEQ